MSVGVENVVSEQDGPVEVPIPMVMDQAKIVELVQNAAFEASNQAIERGMKYADLRSKELLEHFDSAAKRLQQDVMAAGSGKILVVKVNDVQRKLKTTAAPCLGRMIVNAKLGLHTLLVGPAGCGKTHAAGQLAEALELKFDHCCLTAGASETWLFGRQTPNGFVNGGFAERYEFGGVFLGDEYDAIDANMALSINGALANGELYNPISGKKIPKHKDFVFVGAANTMGKGADMTYTGRNRIDAASLDRFVVITVDYSKDLEKELCPDARIRTRLWNAREQLRKLKSPEIVSTRALVAVYKQVQAGITLEDALKSVTASWPDVLVDQIGILKNLERVNRAEKNGVSSKKAKNKNKKGSLAKPIQYGDFKDKLSKAAIPFSVRTPLINEALKRAGDASYDADKYAGYLKGILDQAGLSV